MGAVWLQFFICMGAITFSGTQLTRYGDVLAEKTGLGRTWMGLVALALVTSLPELANGASAVLWVAAPDLAVGDLMGSCVFNLLILAVVDVFYPPGPILTYADRGHILAAAFGVMLLAVVSLELLVHAPMGHFSIKHLGFSTPVLLGCYLIAMRVMFRYQRRERAAYLADHEEVLVYPDKRMGEALWKFAANAAIVVAAGIWLPYVADNLAQIMGWHRTMVGTLFVAAATSMPETVVTISALKLGAVDLAVGNLFGSNLVNMAIIGVVDLIYSRPLLQVVSSRHAATGLMAILMTGIAVAELVYRPKKKALRWMSLGAFLLAFLYAANVYFHLLAQSD